MEAPHVSEVAEVYAHFGLDPAKGLTGQQVEKQRAEFGVNELSKEEKKSIFELIWEQFEDLLVRILLAAAVVSFFLAAFGGDAESEGITAYIEPLVILLILIANAAVGVFQESNAEKALEALKALQPDLAHALRGGKWENLPAADLVPGDMIEVRVGDKVPADARLVELRTTTLRLEQSSLTGESVSVQKQVEALKDAEPDCEIQTKTNILFASTTVANGVGRAVVTATGMQMEIGKIQSDVAAAGGEDQSTPLQKKLEEFGQMLTKVIGVICVVVWVINYKNFSDPVHGSMLRGCIYYFKIAVALAVAAIPEGLPAVITTCLALGTRKMAKKNSIVRRLPSVETLGCTTVICTDKTGTLTTNQMSCVKMFVPDTDTSSLTGFSVEGTTSCPVGKIIGTEGSKNGSTLAALSSKDVGLQSLARAMCLCNGASLRVTPSGTWTKIGEPTESALLVLVEKLGAPAEKGSDASKWWQTDSADRPPNAVSDWWHSKTDKIATLEFTRDRKSMSVIVKDKGANSNNYMLVKGAPEHLLSRCETMMLPDGKVVKLDDGMRKAIDKSISQMAQESLRTLAMASKMDLGNLSDYNGPTHPQHKQLTNPDNFIQLEQKLCFLGMVGLMDPPRPEVAGAIAECRQAGIKVVMITGDNKLTAEAIALKVGILRSRSELATSSLTGKEFEGLTEEAKKYKLSSTDGFVFSRTEPRHKQQIVKILRELNEICAMTGDGVNDAPALKMADIGVAMGIAGTEVAKEAADMILADDNFSSIVVAVEEGRSIYNNMKAFIRYLISSNIGEVASIFLTAALGIPEGLAPVQLLWVNLVTDGPPATALGFNPPDVDVMRQPPRRADEGLISGWVFFRYLVIGLYVGVATVGIFVQWFVYGLDPADNNTLVSPSQLMNWGRCHDWEDFSANPVFSMAVDPETGAAVDPCSYFTLGKAKASTLSLTVLVTIEMLNALNALSEDGSLIEMPPWANPYLILAICGSLTIHLFVLYLPVLESVFAVVPLSATDWYFVLLWSIPVILIDEVLKVVGRLLHRRGPAQRRIRAAEGSEDKKAT
uniref:P-type Ca(2+) transporter n=1 Tax=Chromera velia CCMP2878 TaxID=1169474 RepID=A0A0G4G932_9ALVE|mmetsp:Transcript_49599/g.97717  ORF Transcript_49599/g.97717 Transcript_49599/m.97717 type:complete len:1056 (+) Transcript_49599:338-3505(+)|eukprot:Cvel_583.t1-p1 / transcript=Cvel_583.t1 / gene=Cvel_583 / organism=Chromera_velia_CCMP2878 / gene_product=Calcium-transporting ATPase 2, endoplasmic, putative / transcript_product=Calcium-transporting ATPase 2, endoplasmic, putative / location=Cvel_scaffold18:41068-50411(+) / protein_length=1055 / sequence_SO=supercontig / SO=protein_coding / is_pseudo=false